MKLGGVQMRSVPVSPLLSTNPNPTDIVKILSSSSSSSSSPSRSKSKLPHGTVAQADQVDTNKNPFFFVKRREAVGSSTLDFVSNPAAQAASSCELTVAPTGLAYCDKVMGYGPKAVKGQLIKAHYVGKLGNGKVVDSSYNRRKPLTFRVGIGAKRSLKLPPEVAYGARGAGSKGRSCLIPPNSVLLF